MSVHNLDTGACQFPSDLHHLTGQTRALSLPVSQWGATLDEQSSVSPAYLALGETAGVDTDTTHHILWSETQRVI